MVLVSRKFSLNCLLISISGNFTWTRSEEDRQDGKMIEIFIFLFFFVNRFGCCFFFTVFNHHHYQIQGFVFMSFILISLFNTRFHSHLVSFHFFFFNKK